MSGPGPETARQGGGVEAHLLRVDVEPSGPGAFRAGSAGGTGASAYQDSQVLSLLYEMLTGRVPSGRFKLPAELNRELPAAVDSIVDKALQQDPTDRYVSVREFAGALGTLVRGDGEAGRRKELTFAATGITRKCEAEELRTAQQNARHKSGQSVQHHVPSVRDVVNVALRPSFHVDRFRDKDLAKKVEATSSAPKKQATGSRWSFDPRLIMDGGFVGKNFGKAETHIRNAGAGMIPEIKSTVFSRSTPRRDYKKKLCSTDWAGMVALRVQHN